jgi:hypothetical protein
VAVPEGLPLAVTLALAFAVRVFDIQLLIYEKKTRNTMAYLLK